MVMRTLFYLNENSIITSHFETAIGMKKIIIVIGHVLIQTKFCVWGGKGTKFCFE